jgi:hypothetical protein
VLDVLARAAYGATIPRRADLGTPSWYRPAGAPADPGVQALPPPVMPYYDSSEDKSLLDLRGDDVRDYLAPPLAAMLESYGPSAYKHLMVSLNGR